MNIRQSQENIYTGRKDESGRLPFAKRDEKKIQGKYIYAHYEYDWEFDEEYGFLPKLSKISFKPGANDVASNGDPSGALRRVRKKGGTIIEPTDSRLGKYRDYLVSYPTTRGRKYFAEKWMIPAVTKSGRIIWNEEEALGYWKDFRAKIRDSGIVDPMTPDMFEEILRKMKRRRDAYSRKAARNPFYSQNYEKIVDRIEKMEEAWDKYAEQMDIEDKPLFTLGSGQIESFSDVEAEDGRQKIQFSDEE